MKPDIHPQYYPEAQVTCACGNAWTVGSTVPAIRTDICSKCHPFFSGEQRIVDAGGRVDRFLKKLERRDQAIAQAEQEKGRGTSTELPVMELDLSARARKVLVSAGLKTVGDVLARLEAGGDDTLTNLSGFGLKSLATLKKRLRSRGFVLPGDVPGAQPAQEDDETPDDQASD